MSLKLFRLLLSLLFLQLTRAAIEDSSRFSAKTNSNFTPITFTRLKHDRLYLQLYRKYQPKFPFEEKPIRIRLENASQDFVYYENSDVNALEITRDEVVLESLDRTYRYRLIPSYIYDYDDAEERRLSSDPKLVNYDKCSEELDFLQQNLINYSNSSDLIQFFDSYANDEPGLLLGNYFWMGNWRQCSKQHSFGPPLAGSRGGQVKFNGRYCVAAIRSSTWNDKIRAKREELIAKNYFKYPNQEVHYEKFFRIQIGFCLPESCDSSIFDKVNGSKRIVKKLISLKLDHYYNSFNLSDIFCLPDESSPFRRISTSGRILLSLISCWILMILSVTLYDLLQERRVEKRRRRNGSVREEQEPTTIDKFVIALSLRRNYKKLVSTKSLYKNYNRLRQLHKLDKEMQAQQQNLDSANGAEYGRVQTPAAIEATEAEEIKSKTSNTIFINSFKVISIPYIILGHTGMIWQHLMRFPLESEDKDDSFMFHVIMGSVFFVDWFFLITGFLITYTLFTTKLVQKANIYYWCYTIFHRYWRLAPIYIIVFWFAKSLFEHTGSGPTWDYATSNQTLRSICHEESWLYPVAMIQNLHPLHMECMMQSWYLANDFQFYLITPFLLALLAKSTLAGWLVILNLIGACMGIRFYSYLTDPKVQSLDLLKARIDTYMRHNWDIDKIYLRPHYRVAPYLIGILCAHYVYMVLAGKWKSVLYEPPLVRKRVEAGGDDEAEGATTNQPAQTEDPTSDAREPSIIKRHLGGCLWLIGCLMVSFMLMSSLFLEILLDKPSITFAKYFAATIYAVCHASAGSGLGLMIVTTMLGKFYRIKIFLSHPIWTILAKLNFSTYLLHLEFIYFIMQSAGYLSDIRSSMIMTYFFQVTFLSYCGAFLLTLFLEMPLAQLEAQFIGSMLIKSHKRQS